MLFRRFVELGISLVLCVSVQSQTVPTVSVSEIKAKTPVMEPHLLKVIDREIILKLSNATQEPVVVYGADLKGVLQPVRYRLWFNKKTNRWEYPERSGKPVPWNKISSLYKHERILRPGEEILFSSFLSSTADCDQIYRFTVQVKVGKAKKPVEIVSGDVTVGTCERPETGGQEN